MPQAVTHFLAPLITGSLIKDKYEKIIGEKSFPLYYVLIAGIGGVLPDIDIAVFWVLHWFGFTLGEVHRTFTHTIFVPLLFLICSGIFYNREIVFRKTGLKLRIVFLMLAMGTLFHLVLDAILCGSIMPLYPFFVFSVGLNLIELLPTPLNNLALPTLDGVLLVFWVIWLEWKKKISDFI